MRHLSSLTLLFAASFSTAVFYGAQQPAAAPEKPATTPLPAHQPTTAADAPQRDSSFIDDQGRAHVTRIVPVPSYLSRQTRYWLSEPMSDADPHEPLAQRRAGTDKWALGASKEWLRLYPAELTEEKIAGVPVRIIVPADLPAANKDKVLLNLHGGGFNSDSGSYTETIPMAGMAKIKVIAVLYRLAPEHPFPAALDDSIAVYRELLKTHKPEQIVIYGTSAGAILTGEVAVKLKQSGLPMPAALGIFSGMGDFARAGDSLALYSLRGFSGHLDPPDDNAHDPEYVGSLDPKDPVLSPIYADLHGMPPTLFITSGRDLLLSGTINLHRAFLNAGNDARLVVYDALPHAFWYSTKLPESLEANHVMADFMAKQLAK
ncbi:alpha/beta hydrolase [Acidicapsa ligni]|uniref:alpha/beta hydrolase n=1 Tax=Acidicapsa ligni TaxID=542300 RepID=UPI0021E0136D|nr:alpha/beta hydrolase [Acidicapsa ligni]